MQVDDTNMASPAPDQVAAPKGTPPEERRVCQTIISIKMSMMLLHVALWCELFGVAKSVLKHLRVMFGSSRRINTRQVGCLYFESRGSNVRQNGFLQFHRQLKFQITAANRIFLECDPETQLSVE